MKILKTIPEAIPNPILIIIGIVGVMAIIIGAAILFDRNYRIKRRLFGLFCIVIAVLTLFICFKFMPLTIGTGLIEYHIEITDDITLKNIMNLNNYKIECLYETYNIYKLYGPTLPEGI